ncbi:hypothetical protein HanIR_Chr00c28g0911411 [Helianthus annuus]|nr:hypothetical protein HanIR_Chr00c28g0911411 [Helianthus annuus]
MKIDKRLLICKIFIVLQLEFQRLVFFFFFVWVLLEIVWLHQEIMKIDKRLLICKILLCCNLSFKD